jgi:acyl carrier protein
MAPARTAAEAALCSIWAEVLELDEVGIHDPFLDLGGQSLAAARIIARIAETLRVDLPLRALFETPTIAQLGTVIAERLARGSERAAQERILAELERLSETDADRLAAEQAAALREESHE